MISNPINQNKEIGQSVWYDDLSRELILSGNVEKLVRRGITGVTSNHSIFNKAISSGYEYDSSLNLLNQKQFKIQQIYENLTIEDIKNAADVLKPVYKKTNMKDGYVSLEVNPHFANNMSSTISEAEKLFHELNKSNAGDITTRLRKLKELEDQGLITKEEAARKRKGILKSL